MHDGDPVGELGEERGLLDRRVATTDHGDLVATEEEAIAGGARRQSVSDEALFGLEAEHQRLCAGADDHRLGPILGVTHPDPQRPLGEIDGRDLLGQDLRAEALRLGSHVRHQLGAHDAVGKPGEVLDLGGQHQLTAGLVARARRFAFDQQRREVRPSGVHRSGEARWTRSDDDDIANV